ncbi:MAG: HAD family hydrolase [Methanoregula sp.]|nr:MAG: HAD family hydrolase [Methanoregula sp.]
MPEAAGTQHRHITAVIFDMDNTLFDFVEAKLISCAAVIAYLNVPVEPVVLLRYFLRPAHGFEDHENIRDFLRDNDCNSETAFARCCAIYDEEKVAAIRPYPHVAETLSALRSRGLKLAVVTDAHNGNALKRLRKAGLEEFFDAIITMDMHGKAKPSPEPFLLVMKKLGVAASETMLVGDSIRRDILPAKALGILTVHAVYGDRNFHEGERDGADFVIHGIKDLIGIVQG